MLPTKYVDFLGTFGTRGATASLVMLLLAVPAAAQQGPTADTTKVYRLEEVVVVGRNETVQTSSFLQTALKIQPAGINSLDMLNRAPGFNFTAADANGFYEYGQNIQMRVFNGQQLGFTVDGIPLGNQGAAGGTPAGRIVESESLDQGTVHQGSGNIETMSNFGLGGSIVYNTSRPRAQRGGELRLAGGQFATRRGYLRYDTGGLSDGLTSYVSVSQNIFDKWRSRGDQRRFHVESKLRQDFTGGFISLNTYYNKRNDHDFLDISVADFESHGRDLDLSETFLVLPDKAAQADANALFYDAWSNRREDFLLGVNLETRPSARTSLSLTPYFQNQGGIGTWLPDYRPDATQANPLDAAHRDQTRNTWRETQYQLNRYGATGSYSVNFSGSNTISVGAWTEHYERIAKRVWFDLPNNDSYEVNTIRDQVTPYWTQFDRNYDANTVTGYVKGKFRLGDRFTVSGGVRAHYYEMAYYDDLGAEARKLDDGVPFLPQIGFVFDAAGDHQLFGSVSRNFSQVPDDAIRQNAPVNGEKSMNVDFGYRFLRPGRTTSIAGYFVKYTDKIESITFGAFDRYASEDALQNVGGITGMGVEVTGDYDLGSGLGVFASANFAQSTYDGDVLDANEDGGELRIDGNEAVFTPKFQGFGELRYTSGDLTLAVNGRYVGSRAISLSGPAGGDPSAQERLDAYFLAGVSATYDISRITLSVNGTNLTDTAYLASSSGIGPGTARRPGGGTYFPGSPRWITFGIATTF